MIKSLKRAGVVALGLAAMGFAVPEEASGQSITPQQRKKEQRLLRQLKKLPRANGPVAKVRRLSIQLTKIRPLKSSRNFRLAWQRFPVGDFGNAVAAPQGRRLANQIERIVRRNVNQGRIDRAPGVRQVRNVERQIPRIPTPTPPAPPTPPPYGA